MPSTKNNPNVTIRRDPQARSVTFRLPLVLHEYLQSMGEQERRSLNSATVILLEEAVAARASKAKARATREAKKRAA
jgi:hypothetical protein